MRRSRFFLFGFIVILILCLLIFWAPKKDKASTPISRMAPIDEAYERILNSSVHSVEGDKLIEGALRGMTETIGDPYSKYMTKDEAKSHRESLSDERVGIGLEIVQNKGRFIVVTPMKESPAEKAGVKPYDEIVRVDGERLEGKSLSQLLSAIKGKKGTSVTLTVFRETDNRHMELNMIRSSLQIHTVTSERIEQDESSIGYVSISLFGEKTAEEWEKQTRTLVKQGIDGLLIDVRGNPGGYLHSVEQVIGTMLKNGQIYAYMQDPKGVLEPLSVKVTEEDDYLKVMNKIPIVLLQNEGSASASEVLSGALKSNQRALISGSKSFGKGTVQETWELTNGGEVKLSSHKWLTPKQQWIHGTGIQADFEVEASELYEMEPLPISGSYQVGDFHEDIMYGQKVLKALGYSISREDGYFDEDTAKAVLAFKKEKKLKSEATMDNLFNRELRETILTYKKSKKHDNQLQMSLGYLFHSLQK
ncbi:S41 family peptidase [Paenisporosarcina antarctica]|uniref:PDZ domain-containing protein n=1 Tax=Paenisporosarcina antarctica TaxID=417367 RepID=A0A4P6ZZ56_9BACL|nr:S41 family peptidase [Paenisporosarcina antarctica]QBP41742.1 PDZ domain-containing protein [Paenisporosarcina antarctica]